MFNEIYETDEKRNNMRSGPLGLYIERFALYEKECGYTLLTILNHLRVVSALNDWLCQQGLEAYHLNEEQIDKFLYYRRRYQKPHRSGRHIICRFLVFLRKEGVATPCEPIAPSDTTEKVMLEYAEYLSRVRGLVSSTIDKYTTQARHFLWTRFDDDNIQLDEFKATEVRSYVVDFAQKNGSNRAKEMIVALRAFLRWLMFNGSISTDLAAAVPTVADWHHTSLPTTITQEQVNCILHNCDQSDAKGCRDYAILLLIARLGLRAGEIVRLRLEDINWRVGELTIRRKADRIEQLPLPKDAGKALMSYIKDFRPVCTERRVFLCTNAPLRGLGHASTVSAIVSAALSRAELSPPNRGAHLLRHTLATKLLAQGATLIEIGALLGHRDLAATEIYAKVDIDSLRLLAQPWPGNTP